MFKIGFVNIITWSHHIQWCFQGVKSHHASFASSVQPRYAFWITVCVAAGNSLLILHHCLPNDSRPVSSVLTHKVWVKLFTVRIFFLLNVLLPTQRRSLFTKHSFLSSSGWLLLFACNPLMSCLTGWWPAKTESLSLICSQKTSHRMRESVKKKQFREKNRLVWGNFNLFHWQMIFILIIFTYYKQKNTFCYVSYYYFFNGIVSSAPTTQHCYCFTELILQNTVFNSVWHINWKKERNEGPSTSEYKLHINGLNITTGRTK